MYYKKMEELFQYSASATKHINTDFVRYLYEKINWNSRLIEILGGRGVGKTTLMLQRVKALNDILGNQAIYISLDDQLMFKYSIVELAEELDKYGVKYLFLDEVHKYPPKIRGFDWSAEIKNIYDRFPQLKIIYSGSSILELYKGMGDLSRRKSSYRLAGMSFREYLQYNNILKVESITLKEILLKHTSFSNEIANAVKIIPHFKNYLKNGYFPFYKDDPDSYYSRLSNVLNVIIETDIPTVSEITFESTLKIKKLLSAISSTAPYVPNLVNLRKELFISDQRTLLRYLDYLDKTEVISYMSQKAKGNKALQKPDKILIANSNYIYSLQTANEEIGTVRETFFVSQLRVNHSINIPAIGDYLIDDHWVFEVGGKNKTINQIKNLKNAYLAKDDIENGIFNQIPLWLFGFLY